jgi:hypothetical protein
MWRVLNQIALKQARLRVSNVYSKINIAVVPAQAGTQRLDRG